MRKDLFDVLQKFAENKPTNLKPEGRRYLERSIIEGRQDGMIFILSFRICCFIKTLISWFELIKGLHLDEETRNKVKELKKKLSDMQLECSKNINEENSKFAFKLEDLDGVPNDVINSLEKVYIYK